MKMKTGKIFKGTALLLSAVMASGLMTACGSTAAAQNIDYSSMTVDQITKAAKQEGKVDSVGMPDTWANWIETWGDLKDKYGVNHADMDMSSAEELALFKSEGKDATKDIGDVGQQWGPVAVSENLALAYKTSYWDQIPDWAKDKDGKWMVCYLGTMSIITNNNEVKNPPKSFADILAGDYKVTVGDVTTASQAQHAILATAYAMGGSIDNLQPAYDFWTKLAKAGRIDTGETSTARIESGEIAVGLLWDYNALNYRDNAVKNNPSASFTVCIPSDGSVQSGYASVININAPHPYAACLAREYILSDAGQINLAKGYATPIRSQYITIPDDVQAKRIDSSEYKSAVAIKDFEKWSSVCQDIITYWQDNILPLIK